MMGAGVLEQAHGMWMKGIVANDLESTGDAILSTLDFI